MGPLKGSVGIAKVLCVTDVPLWVLVQELDDVRLDKTVPRFFCITN